jgi:sec-independent protein translocase protein TatC
MAGPMYLLYEISIWLGYLVARSREKGLAAK